MNRKKRLFIEILKVEAGSKEYNVIFLMGNFNASVGRIIPKSEISYIKNLLKILILIFEINKGHF